MKYNLSEITDVIQNRRTIDPKHFNDRKIYQEQIEFILNNAIWAPTHGNTQPWHFTVFENSSKQSLSEFLTKTYINQNPNPSKSKLNSLKTRPIKAGVVIAISLKRDPLEQINEIEEIEAVACAIQNIQLTCTAWGLGSFWSTPKLIYSAEMNSFLQLSDKDKCLGLLYIGYVNESYKWPKGQRKPIEYVTTWVSE